MPILLTTPKNTGDLDSNAPDGEYKELKIISFSLNPNQKKLYCVLEYGNTINDEWVKGVLSDFSISIGNTPEREEYDSENELVVIPATTEYDDLMAMLPFNTTDSLYTQVAKALYQYLLDKELFAGTII